MYVLITTGGISLFVTKGDVNQVIHEMLDPRPDRFLILFSPSFPPE